MSRPKINLGDLPKRELHPGSVYKTPFVLGTSCPPVLSIACRMARASALKADSDLQSNKSFGIHRFTEEERTCGDHFLLLRRQREG